MNSNLATQGAKWLLECGAEDVLAITSILAEDVPSDVKCYAVGAGGDSIMAGLRHFITAMVQPTSETMGVVDAFDPDGTALVISDPFHDSAVALGRRVYGARRPEWLALEDKSVIDAFWDRVGVERAPSTVVAPQDAPTVAAEMDRSLGTVWAADNTEGWHGGADGTRWVRDANAARDAASWFGERCATVRVMPFLEGIPCSIHGYVTHDGVDAFRPVEMLTLRGADHRFVYAGVATFWDPPTQMRAAMRETARLVGSELRDSVGYLGGFSIDGVCTGEGFLPTEMNTRYSTGLAVLAGTADVSLGSISRALIEGVVDVPPGLVEEAVLPAADATRVGGISMPVGAAVQEDRVGVTFNGQTAMEVDPDDEAAWGTMTIKPSLHGSHVSCRLDPERVAVGSSLAPRVAALAELANTRWDLGLPPLEPAPEVVR